MPLTADNARRLTDAFVMAFGRDPEVIGSAPGRLNWIGEHTDYNEGWVLPMAIEQRLWVVGAHRDDAFIRCRSNDLQGTALFSIEEPALPTSDWTTHVRGIATLLKRQGIPLTGADLFVISDLPRGGGVSSSTALEIATAQALIGLNRTTVDPVALAKLAREAEQEFTGIRCGIMDQMTMCAAQQGHAMWLDCRTLKSVAIPVSLGDHAILLCDSRVSRELAASEYNIRRQQCEEGVALLRQRLPEIRSLRDVNETQLEEHREVLPATIFKRCRHVVTEGVRVLRAAGALKAGIPDFLGDAMTASHRSLRDDYEVSCEELDFLVDQALSAGALGARLVGGGFGGCTINLVANSNVEHFQQQVAQSYKTRFDHEVRWLRCAPGGPACRHLLNEPPLSLS